MDAYSFGLKLYLASAFGFLLLGNVVALWCAVTIKRARA